MSSMVMDEDDAAFQADLARAIAASLEPDALGTYEPNTRNSESHNWNALLAAGEAATSWGGRGRGPGGGFGTGIPSSLAPTSGGGLSSPNLLVSDLEEDEDDEYQRQLAAAMEASLQSVQDENQRRALTTDERLDEVTDYDKDYARVGLGRGGDGGGREHYLRSEGCGEIFPGGGVHGAGRFDVDPMRRHAQRPRYQVPHPPPSPAPPHHHHHNYQPPVWQQQQQQPQPQPHPQAVPPPAVPAGGGAVCCSSGLVLKPLAASRAARSGSSAALHPLSTSPLTVPTRTVTTAIMAPSQRDADIPPRPAATAAAGPLPAATQPSAAARPPMHARTHQTAAAGAGLGVVPEGVWRETVAAGGAEVHRSGPPARAHSLPVQSPQCDTTCPSTAATDSSRASSEGEIPLPRSLPCEASLPRPTVHHHRLVHSVAPSPSGAGGVGPLMLSSSPVKHARAASLGGAGESVQPVTKRSRPESSNSNDSAGSGGGGGVGPSGLVLGAAGGTREFPGGSGSGSGRMGSPEDSGLLPPAGGGRGGKGGVGGMELGTEMERFWEDGGAELLAVSHSPPERPASASSCCATVAGSDVVLGGPHTTMMAADGSNGCGSRGGGGGANGSGGFTLDLSAVAAATVIAATSKTGASENTSQFLVVPVAGANGHQHPAAHAMVGVGGRNAPGWALHASSVPGGAVRAPDDVPTWQQDAGRMLRSMSADGECGGDDDVMLLSCRETMLPLTYERSHWDMQLRTGGQQRLSGAGGGVAAPLAGTKDSRGSPTAMNVDNGRGGGGGRSTSRGAGGPPDTVSWQHSPFVLAAAEAPTGAALPLPLTSQATTTGTAAGGSNVAPLNVSQPHQSNKQHPPQQPTVGSDPSVSGKVPSQSAAGCVEALPGHTAPRQTTALKNKYPSLLPSQQQSQQQQIDNPQWSNPIGPPRWRYSGADRRMLRHQQVWWWCGPGQVQLGRITSIDYRSEPPLYTVRLDPDHVGKEGEQVVATADCLLPYVSHGDWVMCRLPPPPCALRFIRRVTVEGEDEGHRRRTGCGVMMEEVVAQGQGVIIGLGHGAGAEGLTRQGPSVAVPPSDVPGEIEDEYNQAPCVWMAGRMQHCIFDGPVPRVSVLLGGSEALPYELPYENVVPVSDAAESSGCGSSSSSTSGGGGGGRRTVETQGGGARGSGGDNGGGHTAVNTCLEIVLA